MKIYAFMLLAALLALSCYVVGPIVYIIFGVPLWVSQVIAVPVTVLLALSSIRR